MFTLDLVSFIIFLVFIFSMVTTFAELRSSSKRKRRRRTNTSPQGSGRMDTRQRSQRPPSSAGSSRRNNQKNQGRTNETGRYNDPVFNSSGSGKYSSERQGSSIDLPQYENTPRSLESTADKRRRQLASSRSNHPAKQRREWDTPSTSSYMSSVVSLDEKKSKKKKKETPSSLTTLKGKQLRQAVIYKEILDKPISMRND